MEKKKLRRDKIKQMVRDVFFEEVAFKVNLE
jgi:hypothetical protein